MLCKLKQLFTRAKHILQTEGLLPLLMRGFNLLIGYFFQYGNYYLYETDISKVLEQNNEQDLIPDIPNFTLKIVSTNEQGDKLEREGFEFRSQFLNAKERLDRGAIAFCIFVEQELANIGWIALTQQAKDSIDSLPYQVKFDDKEGYTGAAKTQPKYRNMGLMRYNYFKRLQFLKENGILRDRAAVAKSNIASQKGAAKISDVNICAEARFLKIMWCRFWWEKPLTTAKVNNGLKLF
jgi:hypothetical protein